MSTREDFEKSKLIGFRANQMASGLISRNHRYEAKEKCRFFLERYNDLNIDEKILEMIIGVSLDTGYRNAIEDLKKID